MKKICFLGAKWKQVYTAQTGVTFNFLQPSAKAPLAPLEIHDLEHAWSFSEHENLPQSKCSQEHTATF